MRYKAILFDMDGTVLDTLADLHASVNTALNYYGFPPISLEETRCFVGNGAKRLISLAVPKNTAEDEAEKVLDYFLSYYSTHCRIKTAPYSGIVETMTKLRSAGAELAVVSNKPDMAVKELANVFFNGLLTSAVGESSGVRRKPAPDTVYAAAAAMRAEIKDCVYVGDSEVDIETAKNAGMDCISVTWGFRSTEHLINAGASVIINSVDELYKILME